MNQEAWAYGLARAALADALPRRWEHVQAVADRARTPARLFGAEGDLLISAALVHDIGYAPHLVDTGLHAIDGARYLRREGALPRLINLVANHSCAASEAELRGLSAELAEFTDEKSPLRDALWWADMTTGPDGTRTTIEQRVSEIENRYGPDDIVSRFVHIAWPELLGSVTRTEALLREARNGQE